MANTKLIALKIKSFNRLFFTGAFGERCRLKIAAYAAGDGHCPFYVRFIPLQTYFANISTCILSSSVLRQGNSRKAAAVLQIARLPYDP